MALSPRSLGTRLSVLFFAVALALVGLVYLAIVPGLEKRLVGRKLDDLRGAAATYSDRVVRGVDESARASTLDRLVREASDASSARVTLLNVNSQNSLETYIASDSSAEVEILDRRFEIARRAALEGKTITATESTPSGRVGEAGRPIFGERDGQRVVRSVVVYSAPLRDAERSVAVVRRRVLAAGALVLLVAVLAGIAIARQLSRRIGRLETAATRVARGDFEVRFLDTGKDEIGQLAATLDAMRRQLAELDEARSRFIATASHELRTPIFSLGGYLELLQDEDVDEATRQGFLTQVRQQVERLQRLAGDLLDLSRLEAGSLELRIERADLAEIAQGVAREFEPALTSHESTLELHVPGGPVRALCDPERVAQVMRILIDNALTHTPTGTGVVVSTIRQPDGARVDIADRGPGITTTMLPHIFEPFFTSDDAQGSGLGLAIARELTERMEGALEVASTPGRTVFTLELPA